MDYLYEVLIPKPFNTTFTYSYDEDLKLGKIVLVEFRKKNLIGLIWGKSNKIIGNNQTKTTSKAYNIKPIFKGYDLYLSPKQLEFLEWVANYNLIPKGMVFKMMLSVNKHFDKKVKLPTAIHFPGIKEKLTFTAEQKEAIERINNAFDKNQYSPFLLDGKTGSGKTEVYLEAVEKALLMGKQALILLPEILLTTQLLQRFKNRLNIEPIVWHSNIKIKEKKHNWQIVQNSTPHLIVGARSALFLPFKDLGLIVIDEEHDQSFKQEVGSIYNARDMAMVKAKLEQIPIILASATPSVDSTYNVACGKIEHIELQSRYNQMLPEIKLIDLNTQNLKKGEWISEELRLALKNNLANGKQSLLFLNRRGYAPVNFCGECKEKILCPDCSSAMVEHKSSSKMICHYCGFSSSKHSKCPTCGSDKKMMSLGPGVERIEEEVKNYLPAARTIIFTSDHIDNHKDAARVINMVASHQVDIVIGTQMVAKGLHFPKLNLVGIIESDKNLIGGDIRTYERTYQLLHQVAGRAGREEHRGLVLIQTYTLNNRIMNNLATGRRDEFYQAELADRKEANMPPFSRLAIVSIQSLQEKKCIDFSYLLLESVPLIDKIEVLGPMPAPLFMLRKQFRYRFILKAEKSVNLQKFIKDWIYSFPVPSGLKIKIDIDPYNFL